MPDPTLELGEFSGRMDDVARVERAASYLGQATGMVANLYAVGKPRKAEIWLAEEQAWQQRQARIIEEAPLGKEQLTKYAAETACAQFESTRA